MGWHLGTTNSIKPVWPEISLLPPPLSTLHPSLTLLFSKELVSLHFLLKLSCPLISRWVQPKEDIDRSTAGERRGGSGYLFHWFINHYCLGTGWQRLYFSAQGLGL